MWPSDTHCECTGWPTELLMSENLVLQLPEGGSLSELPHFQVEESPCKESGSAMTQRIPAHLVNPGLEGRVCKNHCPPWEPGPGGQGLQELFELMHSCTQAFFICFPQVLSGPGHKLYLLCTLHPLRVPEHLSLVHLAHLSVVCPCLVCLHMPKPLHVHCMCVPCLSVCPVSI
jgi:hypothetical protein